MFLKLSSFNFFSFFCSSFVFFFYLVFQNTDLNYCFIKPTVYSFQCIIYFRYLRLLNILIIFTLNSLSNQLLVSISSSSSGEFSCSFSRGHFVFVFPFWVFLYTFPLVITPISDIVSRCNQQPDLSTTWWGRVITSVEVIASLQADATYRGFLCLRKIAPEIWGMTQDRDPGGCSFRSLPRATKPRLSSSVSNPLYPPSVRAQGKWLQRKFCALAV